MSGDWFLVVSAYLLLESWKALGLWVGFVNQKLLSKVIWLGYFTCLVYLELQYFQVFSLQMIGFPRKESSNLLPRGHSWILVFWETRRERRWWSQRSLSRVTLNPFFQCSTPILSSAWYSPVWTLFVILSLINYQAVFCQIRGHGKLPLGCMDLGRGLEDVAAFSFNFVINLQHPYRKVPTT